MQTVVVVSDASATHCDKTIGDSPTDILAGLGLQIAVMDRNAAGKFLPVVLFRPWLDDGLLVAHRDLAIKRP